MGLSTHFEFMLYEYKYTHAFLQTYICNLGKMIEKKILFFYPVKEATYSIHQT